MCAGEVGGDGLGVDAGHAGLHLLWVEDVVVVGDAAVLLVEHVPVIVEALELEAVAEVGAVEAPVHVVGVLILVGALRVEVVEVGADLSAGVDVAGEDGAQAVLARLFSAAGVVGEQRHGDARVVEALGL